MTENFSDFIIELKSSEIRRINTNNNNSVNPISNANGDNNGDNDENANGEDNERIQPKPSIPKFLIKVSSSFFARATAKDVFMKKMDKTKEKMRKKREERQNELERNLKFRRSKSDVSSFRNYEHGEKSRGNILNVRMDTNLTNKDTEENPMLTIRSQENSEAIFKNLIKENLGSVPNKIYEDQNEYDNPELNSNNSRYLNLDYVSL